MDERKSCATRCTSRSRAVTRYVSIPGCASVVSVLSFTLSKSLDFLGLDGFLISSSDFVPYIKGAYLLFLRRVEVNMEKRFRLLNLIELSDFLNSD